MTVPWQTKEWEILHAAGWELFHQMDDSWFAVHAATGRVALIEIGENHPLPPGIEVDSLQHFLKLKDWAAYQLLDCLAEFYNHQKCITKRDEERDS